MKFKSGTFLSSYVQARVHDWGAEEDGYVFFFLWGKGREWGGGLADEQ